MDALNEALGMIPDEAVATRAIEDVNGLAILSMHAIF